MVKGKKKQLIIPSKGTKYKTREDDVYVFVKSLNGVIHLKRESDGKIITQNHEQFRMGIHWETFKKI